MCGRVCLCCEVFGEILNESRDLNFEGNRYINWFYLKYNYLEKVFIWLWDCNFKFVVSSGGKSWNIFDSDKGDEDKWDYFIIYVFLWG